MIHLLSYALTVQGAKAAELKSVRTKAAGAVVDFIRFPDQYQFDLLEADAVVQLRDDPEFSTLYQLLSILLRSNNIKVGLHHFFLETMYGFARLSMCRQSQGHKLSVHSIRYT